MHLRKPTFSVLLQEIFPYLQAIPNSEFLVAMLVCVCVCVCVLYLIYKSGIYYMHMYRTCFIGLRHTDMSGV